MSSHSPLNWPSPSLRTPSMVPTPRSHIGNSSNSTSTNNHHSGSGSNSNSNSNAKPKPTLEILPDSRFIVFHGGEHEAATVKLRGRVRFTTPESMSILKPKVRLEGKRKISWWLMGGISATEVADKRVFWNQEHKMGIDSTHKVKAGVIEWPFEFELSPSMPESVEGLRETYIVYHLHASVSRPGWNTRDIVAQEHIRIVRTLGQDLMEMTRSRVNADIWANKISYSISIPTDAIVFGTSLVADVELSPLKKGLRLGKIDLRLMETVVKRIQASEVPDARADRTKQEESEVAQADMEFPEHSRITYEDETVENPVMGDEMYRFKATLPLPKSLHLCRQDVDSHQINVTHRFKLMVNIHNPEGHVSQLVCRLPVKIFISPNLPVDERNEVCRARDGVSDAQLNSAETTMVAPPEYGRHQLDQIYSDIDPAGYMSTAGSTSATPAGFLAQSRRGSQDNLGFLNGRTDGDALLAASVSNHGSATPLALHLRLADLQQRGQASVIRAPGIAFAAGSSSGGASPAAGLVETSHYSPATAVATGSYSTSATNPSPHHPHQPSSANSSIPTSSRNSDEDHTSALQARDYNLSDLSRVPSYNAALRTPGAVTPFVDGPPTYFQAISRPPSPRPNILLLRSTNNNSTSNALGSTGSDLSLTQVLTLTPAQQAEDESRLRMLRARS